MLYNFLIPKWFYNFYLKNIKKLINWLVTNNCLFKDQIPQHHSLVAHFQKKKKHENNSVEKTYNLCIIIVLIFFMSEKVKKRH